MQLFEDEAYLHDYESCEALIELACHLQQFM